MAALEWTSAIQNNVALLLMETPYASLTAEQKALIDNTWTTGVPGGCAGDALSEINTWAQWLTLGGIAGTTDAFAPWLKDETALRAVRTLRPDRYQAFERMANRTKADVLRTFSATDISASAAPSADAFLGHLQNVRKFVITYLIRLDPPVFVPMDTIDQAFYAATNKLWKRANWLFKRRSIILTIAANGTVTNDLSGETLDGIATEFFYYTDDPGGGTVLRHASADVMQRQRTRWGANTGRPQFFRIQKAGDTKTWKFAPSPDAEYTLNAEVYVEGPGTPSSATDTAIFAKFPASFWPLIREATLTEVLVAVGHRNAREMYNKVEYDTKTMLPEYDDIGAPDNNQEIRDVNHDVIGINGCNEMGAGL